MAHSEMEVKQNKDNITIHNTNVDGTRVTCIITKDCSKITMLGQGKEVVFDINSSDLRLIRNCLNKILIDWDES